MKSTRMRTHALENDADSSYNLTMRRVIFGCFVLAIAAFALYGFNAVAGQQADGDSNYVRC